jgi:hypothetical protein
MRTFLRSYDSPGFVVQDFRMIDDRAHVLLTGRPVMYVIATETDVLHLEWCVKHERIILTPLDATWISPQLDGLRDRFGWLWDHVVADPADWIDAIRVAKLPRFMENLPSGFRDLDKYSFTRIRRERNSIRFDNYTDLVQVLGEDRTLASVFLDKSSVIDADGAVPFTPTLFFGPVEDFLAFGAFNGDASVKVILIFFLPPSRPVESLLQEIKSVSPNAFYLHRLMIHGYSCGGAFGSIYGEFIP